MEVKQALAGKARQGRVQAVESLITRARTTGQPARVLLSQRSSPTSLSSFRRYLAKPAAGGSTRDCPKTPSKAYQPANLLCTYFLGGIRSARGHKLIPTVLRTTYKYTHCDACSSATVYDPVGNARGPRRQKINHSLSCRVRHGPEIEPPDGYGRRAYLSASRHCRTISSFLSIIFQKTCMH